MKLPVPNDTTLSQRRRGSEVSLPRCSKDQTLHVVVDATSIKVYEGRRVENAPLRLFNAAYVTQTARGCG
jgi:hypothetical protein